MCYLGAWSDGDVGDGELTDLGVRSDEEVLDMLAKIGGLFCHGGDHRDPLVGGHVCFAVS